MFLPPSFLPRRRRLCRAYGLIELLVVVVIMALLALVLVPRLVGGKKNANGTRTLAPKERAHYAAGSEYIGQINQAILMFKQDHDENNPQSLAELKAYGVTDAMLLDPVSRKPLSYNPQTGVVGNDLGKSGGVYGLGGGATLPTVGN